jgi:hypothetical protein
VRTNKTRAASDEKIHVNSNLFHNPFNTSTNCRSRP